MDGEEVFRERYNALRNVYEQRLEHLTASVRKIYQAVKADEVGMAMQTDPTSSGFFKAHLSEVVENELGAEREEFVHRLVNHVSVLEASCRKYQAELAAAQQRVQQIESDAAARVQQEKDREQNVAELKRHALSLEAQSQSAIQEAQQKAQALAEEGHHLRQERESARAKLERANETARGHREESILLKSQLESKTGAYDELVQKLRAAEFQAERCQVLLAEEQQRSAQLSTETQVQRERFAQAEAKNGDHATLAKQLRAQITELETAYGRSDGELKVMRQKYGSLSEHMESILEKDARSNEDTIQAMQRRVDQLKEKVAAKMQAQQAKVQAAESALAAATAEAGGQSERARQLQLTAERETDARTAVEERLALQEQETRRYQGQVRELQEQVQAQAERLFQERADTEKKPVETTQRLEAVSADRGMEHGQGVTLQGQLRGAADRLVALEQRLASEREACAVLEADLERERQQGREADSAVREQEQAKLALAQHLNEATSNIARLKALVRTERQARETAEQKAELEAKSLKECDAALAAARDASTRAELAKVAAVEEARKVSIEAAELRKQSEEQREQARSARGLASQHEQANGQLATEAREHERLLREKQKEVDSLSAELKQLLTQLEQERNLSRDRQDRESVLAQQVDTFSTQFKQLEAALQRTHDEKTSYQAAQQKVLETHAAERSALERSISSLERKLQAASKEVEHRGLNLREKDEECKKAHAYQEKFLLISQSLSNVRHICSRRLPTMRGQCESLKAQIRSDVQGAAVDMARMVRELHVKFLDSQTTQMASLSVSFEREKVSLQRTAIQTEAETHDQLATVTAAKDSLERQLETQRQRCVAAEELLVTAQREEITAQDKVEALEKWQATLIKTLAVDIPDLEDFEVSNHGGGGVQSHDASIAEIRSRILSSLVRIQQGTSAPLSDEIESLRKASKANGDLVSELRKQYTELEASYNAECEKTQSYEKRLDELDAEAQELRARSKLTDDLERSQSELAMIAELQRMENLNEKRALKSELEECSRKHDLLTEQMNQQHADKLAEVKQHFEGELTKILDQHRELVAELEHRVKNERGRYRELQERTHKQVQQLESQVSTLQESCDLHDYSFDGHITSTPRAVTRLGVDSEQSERRQQSFDLQTTPTPRVVTRLGVDSEQSQRRQQSFGLQTTPTPLSSERPR